MSNPLVPGQFAARGVTAALGLTGTEKEQVAVELVAMEEEYAGQRITWYGYFTPDTTERTLDTLRTLGWKGDKINDLRGIDENMVRMTLDYETYEGKRQLKVKWINPQGGLALKTPLTVDQAAAFAAKMQSAVLAHNAKTGTKASNGSTAKDDSDIQF